MSVAAMTMDDQRLINNYDKMPKQFEQNLQSAVTPLSGPASPTPSGSEEPTTVQHHQYEHHHHATSLPHHHHHHSHQQHAHHHHHHQQTQPEPQQQPQSPSQQQQQQQPTHTIAVAEAVAAAEQRQRLLEEEIETLKVEQTRLAQQCADAQRREKILMRRLANKEQEFQDYVSQIAEYKAAQAPNALALRSALLDPAVNLLFEKLKKELKATKAKLEETQNELSAWKFTPDSNTGKRLMAKCRLLYQENEELGKMTSNGRLAKLEAELAMQKSFSEEVKKSQSELDDFLQELDEDVEGMQSTILFLQQELKMTRDRIQTLEKENYQLKNGLSDDVAKNSDGDVHTQHTGLNGNGIASNVNAIAMPYHSLQPQYSELQPPSPPQQQPPLQQIPATNAINEIKYQPPVLETIDDTACLRTHVPPAVEFYNGNEINQATAGVAMGDDGADGSSSSNTSSTCGPLKFRTAASRKRNYDSDTSESVTVVGMVPSSTSVLAPTPAVTQVAPPQLSVPRCTLPPKKSKLRVTSPIRTLSIQSVDIIESMGTASPQVINLSTNSAIATEPLHIIDNAVVNISNEVLPVAMVVDDEVSGGLAQHILTRRRSVRTQNGGGGSDSN